MNIWRKIFIKSEEVERIQTTFNKIANDYDKQRPYLIPKFNDFYETVLNLSKYLGKVPTKILDLGAGTGLLSAFFLDEYPQCNITLVDFSEDMLTKAKERFSNKNNIDYLIEDLASLSLKSESYDLVVSSLAIHHLPNDLKEKLFTKIYNFLKPGGLFINADQVLGASKFSEKIYTENWKNFVGNSSNLTENDKKNAFDRIKLDIMASLDLQLIWLKELGFTSVDTYYRYYNFIVYMAKK